MWVATSSSYIDRRISPNANYKPRVPTTEPRPRPLRVLVIVDVMELATLERTPVASVFTEVKRPVRAVSRDVTVPVTSDRVEAGTLARVVARSVMRVVSSVTMVPMSTCLFLRSPAKLAMSVVAVSTVVTMLLISVPTEATVASPVLTRLLISVRAVVTSPSMVVRIPSILVITSRLPPLGDGKATTLEAPRARAKKKDAMRGSCIVSEAASI